MGDSGPHTRPRGAGRRCTLGPIVGAHGAPKGSGELKTARGPEGGGIQCPPELVVAAPGAPQGGIEGPKQRGAHKLGGLDVHQGS